MDPGITTAVSAAGADRPFARNLDAQIHCQSFVQGCYGCCVNMRWNDRRVRAFLEDNTRVFHKFFPAGSRPGLMGLARLHLARGGFWDHLLMVLLVMPTFGLSAWLWQRWFGSCPFAGLIDADTRRAGCLIHPLRIGAPDLRRHAFPLVFTLSCNRGLRCPMLDAEGLHLDAEHLAVSRQGFQSLRRKSAPASHAKNV